MDTLFIVKKTLSFFIEPYGLILTFLLFGFFSLYGKKLGKAKFFILSAFVLLLLFAYPPFSNFLVKGLEDVYPKFEPENEKIAYIHVLGNGNNDDTTQPVSSMIGDVSMKRVVEGVLLQKHYENSKMIFTGYEGNTNLPNAMINARLAQMLGVKEEDITTNSKAKDTKDEAIFAKRTAGEKPIIVVTSAMHMLRAVKLFRDQGLDPIPAPTDFKRQNIKTYLMPPTVESLKNSQTAMHEYIGMIWTIIFVH